ncbi:class IIb bacteriocin, lactobin A/cerein 7B family [Sphingobacterium sp. NGMCC 1.201703]|uniref:class IIb bacteriocin, lactobin A/cerein 7B family n=1 Tax=Sphingobacterium sp. NGMCC 1.201703 TaxID=3388657 RepID=UPI0039FC5BE4
MNNLELKNCGIQELNEQEMIDSNGGFLPAVAIGIIWGVQLGLSAVGVGMYLAVKDK